MSQVANELLGRPLTDSLDQLMMDPQKPKALTIGTKAVGDDGSTEDVVVVVARGETAKKITAYVEELLGGGYDG